MKNLLFISAIALLIASCNSGNKGNSTPSHTKVLETSIENIDSLANAPNSVWKNLKTVVEGVAHTGKFSSKIDSVNQFSLVFEDKLSNLDQGFPKSINYTVYACALKPNTKVLIVVSVNSDKFYKAAAMDTMFTTLNEWKQINATFELPDNLSSDDIIKAYVWNQNIGELLVDDFKVELAY